MLRTLKGVHVAFTGILSRRRSEAVRAAKRAGAIVHGGPSARTTVVVRGRPNPLQAAGREGGLKLMEIKRLREKGHRITLLNETQFWRLTRQGSGLNLCAGQAEFSYGTGRRHSGLTPDPEPVVGIAVARRQARPRRRRRPPHLVPPRSSAARAAARLARGGVPVEAPLVDDRAGVEEPVAVRRPAADLPRTRERAVRDLSRRDRVSPRGARRDEPSARRDFPLRFRREAPAPARDLQRNAQYAIASSHVTPTTGCRAAEKSGSVHHGGAAARPDSRKGAYSAFVTGVRPRRNGGEAGIATSSGIWFAIIRVGCDNTDDGALD